MRGGDATWHQPPWGPGPLSGRWCRCTVLPYNSRERPIPIQMTYSNARETLADLWREVEENGEIVIITRRGHGDVALISAAELSSLLEAAHLLRSPANARRLLTSLQRALGDRIAQTLVDAPRRE